MLGQHTHLFMGRGFYPARSRALHTSVPTKPTELGAGAGAGVWYRIFFFGVWVYFSMQWHVHPTPSPLSTRLTRPPLPSPPLPPALSPRVRCWVYARLSSDCYWCWCWCGVGYARLTPIADGAGLLVLLAPWAANRLLWADARLGVAERESAVHVASATPAWQREPGEPRRVPRRRPCQGAAKQRREAASKQCCWFSSSTRTLQAVQS